MTPIDIGIIVFYLAACTALGLSFGRSTQGLEGYFLGERNIPAWALTLSIVATETSTVTFLSVPGVAFNGNYTYLQLPMGYIIGRVLVAWLLIPSYFRGQTYTAYELLQGRFGRPTRLAASILFLITRTLGDGLRLFLTAKVLQQMLLLTLGDRLPSATVLQVSIAVVAIFTVIYTCVGGMKAVIWTDVLQFIIYIIGGLVALAILIGKLPGGAGGLWQQASAAGKTRVFDFAWDFTQPYTFWAGVIGGMFLTCATHGADQLMVQRYLSARNARQAGSSLIASGLVVFAQFVLFLVIGTGLWAFYQQVPPTTPLGRDEEFIHFIVRYLPTGMVGLVIAAIFAAAMSTLSGSLNSSVATTVNDLLMPRLPSRDDAYWLRRSRQLTVVWGLAQMAVAYAAIGLQDNMVNNVLAIASFVTGIILGLFLLGRFTRQVAQREAFIAMLVGLVAVSYVALGPKLFGLSSPLYPFHAAIAWPWYAMIGSLTVFVVACGLTQLRPRTPAPETPQ